MRRKEGQGGGVGLKTLRGASPAAGGWGANVDTGPLSPAGGEGPAGQEEKGAPLRYDKQDVQRQRKPQARHGRDM